MMVPTPRDIAGSLVYFVCMRDGIPNHMVFDTDSFDIGGEKVQCPQFRDDLEDFYKSLKGAAEAWKAKQANG